MKDLIVITAHCPTEEQELELEKCINSVVGMDAHILLISHTHIPIHIQKKCNYYVYDYNNETSTDHNLIGYKHYRFDGKIIQSKFFHKTFYGFAIYRMFCIASQIAINFGYENIHYIEYDCELLDKNLINENSKLLENYDSVIYTDNGKENGFLFGSFKSFKVKTLPENFKNYNKSFIEDEIKKSEIKHLEFFSKNLFTNSGKVFFGNEPSNERFKRGKWFYNRDLHYTFFYNPLDKTLNIFYNSQKDKIEKIFVMVNNQKTVKIEIQPNCWYIKPLGIFDEINNVRIDNSEKIIYELSFDKEFRDFFKINSYISNE
jgi:hypothetical protein